MQAMPSILPLAMLSWTPLLLLCIVALACRPGRRWKHREWKQRGGSPAACEANFARSRRRRGGWGWWWIPLVLFLVWMSRRGFHDQNQWAYNQAHHAERAARVAAEDARRSMLPTPYVTAAGQPAAVIEVRISASKCKDKHVSAADLAAGTLTLIDALPIAGVDEKPVRRRLQELENTVVHTDVDGDTVAFDDVARLTVHQPEDVQNAAIGAIHLRVDEKSRRTRNAGQALLKEVERELASVHDARVKADKATFALATDDRLLTVELAGAHRQSLTEFFRDSEVAGTEPATREGEHGGQSSVTKTIPATMDDRGLVEEIVEIATGAALGEDETVERAIWRAKLRAAETAKDAIARAAANITGTAAKVPASRSAEYNVDSAVAQATRNQKPAWIESPPPQVDEHGVYTMIGSTGAFYSTPQEAEGASSQTRDEMTASFVNLLLGPGASAQVPLGDVRKLPTDKWTGPVERESGLTYYETHVLLKFDQHDQRNVLRAWSWRQSQRQVWIAAIGGGTVLALLATVLAYLKLDTATRGYYSGRLKLLATGIAMVVVMPVCLWAARMASLQNLYPGRNVTTSTLAVHTESPLLIQYDWSVGLILLVSGATILVALLLLGILLKRGASPQVR